MGDTEMIRRWGWRLAALAAGAALSAAVWAQQPGGEDPLAEYRAMFGDDNPAELWEARGEDLWKAPRAGGRSLADTCDFGLGPGKTHGAYSQLPHWFEDTGKVQDLESRLLTCLVRLGADEAELIKHRFGDGDDKSDLEALTAYLVADSKGIPVAVPQSHPKERQAYALGKAIFYYRAGTHDFSCATCHSVPGKRIRLQELPQLTAPEGAREAYTHWPAYRVSQGELRTMEWRIADCFRQQRVPQLDYGSPAAIALISFLAYGANGGEMAAPGLKR